jgi:hypothetical protein
LALGCANACYALTDFEGLDDAPSSASASSASSASASSSASSSASTGSGGAGSGGGGAGGEVTVGGGGQGGGGGNNLCPPPNVDYSGLVLNEIAPKGFPEDWIELYNNGSETIPLCAVFIGQDYDGITPPGAGDRYTFGPGELAAGQYKVIHGVSDFSFGLSKDTPERVTLFAPDGVVLDDTAWTASVPTQYTESDTWARIPNGTGAFKRVASPTQGAANVDTGGAGGSGGI